MADTSQGLRLVEKTVEVLNHLSRRGELTIAQLAEQTGEPRSSLYRLLRRLEQLQLVEAADTRGYFRLGTHLLRWGAAVQAGLDVSKRALPVMEELRERTGLTVYLLVNRAGHGVCIERLGGVRVASQVLQVGGSLPLHAGAAPRSLLAFQPEEAWQEYIDTYGLVSLTAETPSTPERIFEVLRREREQGYNLSDGDVTGGIAALGAPIYNHENKVVAGLSVSGMHDDILGAKADELRELVIERIQSISIAMGYQPKPDEEITNPPAE